MSSPPGFFAFYPAWGANVSLVKYGEFGPEEKGEMAQDATSLTVVVLVM